MRTVTYGAAVSLDGFITDRDGAIDWLHFSSDAQQVMGAYWGTVDTILMGRRTWEFAAAQSGGGSGGDGGGDGGYGGVHTYVFSRTLGAIDRPGVTLVSDDAAGFVRQLKESAGKGICVMGGGDFARSLFEADLVDDVGLNIHPILLGAGAPLFGDAKRRIPLRLRDARPIDGGCLLANYTVVRPA